MSRVKLTISYDGSKFRGFQSQKSHSNTVVNTLTSVLRSVGIFDIPIGSGRTDKGVHASNQVLHLDIPKYWKNRLVPLKQKLNVKLEYIYVKNIRYVDDSFHSRYHAFKRSYRYIISTKYNVFESDYVNYQASINPKLIHEAIKYFEGTHDFKYFHKTGSDTRSSIRTIYDIKFYQYKHYYIFKIVGNGFLRSQVRLMVGFLLEISNQKLNIIDLVNQLNVQKQVLTKPALASGLYLQKISYL